MTRLDDALIGAAGATAPAAREHALGADPVPGGVRFGVWAPRASAVEVVIEGDPEQAHPLRAGTSGYHSSVIAGVAAGARYRFRLDGAHAYPDPVSRFQPDGPHGPSLVVDPAAFPWTDHGWRGVGAARTGDLRAARRHVHRRGHLRCGDRASCRRLSELGVTLLEVMPVAEFPGRFNWGYDGVALFAPYHGYGDAEAFKRFVDAAHRGRPRRDPRRRLQPLRPRRQLPPRVQRRLLHRPLRQRVGRRDQLRRARTPRRCASSSSERRVLDPRVPPRRAAPRRDADRSTTRAARTSSPELAAAARRAALPRSIVLVAENEPQHAEALAPVDAGGYGLDAMWNDDYHHTARVALTGRQRRLLPRLPRRGAGVRVGGAARLPLPGTALRLAGQAARHAGARTSRRGRSWCSRRTTTRSPTRSPANALHRLVEPGAPPRDDRADPARTADADALHGGGVRGGAAVSLLRRPLGATCARRCARAGGSSCGSSRTTRRRVRRRRSPIRVRRRPFAPRSSISRSASRTHTSTRSTATSCDCGARTR